MSFMPWPAAFCCLIFIATHSMRDQSGRQCQLSEAQEECSFALLRDRVPSNTQQINALLQQVDLAHELDKQVLVHELHHAITMSIVLARGILQQTEDALSAVHHGVDQKLKLSPRSISNKDKLLRQLDEKKSALLKFKRVSIKNMCSELARIGQQSDPNMQVQALRIAWQNNDDARIEKLKVLQHEWSCEYQRILALVDSEHMDT